MALITAVALIFVSVFSTSAKTIDSSSPDSSRDGLLWNAPPESMSQRWQVTGYSSLINTPGAMVATTENGIYRLDSTSGNRVWSYERPGSLCHAIQSQGNIVAVFNGGSGCSDVVMLDAATGKYLRQAQYATDSDQARLVTGAEGRIALVTRTFVRLLRNDLVPSSQFGDSPEPLYENNVNFSRCHIYDVAVGPKLYTVSAKCAHDKNTHVRAVQVDPQEVHKSDVPVDVDTGFDAPVTLPVISLSMFSFVTPGNNPAAYTWQLDKDKAEVARENLSTGEYGFGYQDIDGIGYVWRIGDTIHSRSGSEDLSKSVTRDHAIGSPMAAGSDLLIPRDGSVLAWNARADTDTREIAVPGLRGRDFAFAGKTIASFDQGTVTGYASDE